MDNECERSQERAPLTRTQARACATPQLAAVCSLWGLRTWPVFLACAATVLMLIQFTTNVMNLGAVCYQQCKFLIRYLLSRIKIYTVGSEPFQHQYQHMTNKASHLARVPRMCCRASHQLCIDHPRWLIRLGSRVDVDTRSARAVRPRPCFFVGALRPTVGNTVG